MKITIDELNLAYQKANEFKINGYPIRQIVEIDVDRNPLIDKDYFGEGKFVTPFKLKFVLFPNMGSKGAYVLDTDVEIVDEDE